MNVSPDSLRGLHRKGHRGTKPFVLWFTGISGSGKTTLANLLQQELNERGVKSGILDGDMVRDFFENDLGYSRQERITNIKRITFAAMVLQKNDVNVIVANMAPFYEARDFIRRKLNGRYFQVYLEASIDKVMSRDAKGMYKRARDSGDTNVVGLNDVYDVPRNPDLIIDTDNETVEESLAKIMHFLEEKGVLV